MGFPGWEAAGDRGNAGPARHRTIAFQCYPEAGVVVASRVDLDVDEVDLLWQTFLRRFDIEHTFRILKQTPGWTSPKLRNPSAADRWSWLLLAACTQLRLACNLTADLKRSWEKPPAPQGLTFARVRRGFRHLCRKVACPARAPKPSRPGPGRPVTATNAPHPATTCTSRPPATGNHPNPPDHNLAKATKHQFTG